MPDARHSRSDLIALCEDAIRPETAWHDRDSAGAQKQLGHAWALLKAGCEFSIDESMYDGSHSEGDRERTIWLRIRYRGFRAFEMGDEYAEDELFYIPTRARLESVGQRDWY